MKKLSIITAALALLASSCVDLELRPLSEGSSGNWYSTPEEIQLSINDFYKKALLFPEGMLWGDDCVNRANPSSLWSGTITSESSAIETRWANFYKGIGRAQKILKSMEHAREMGVGEAQIRQYEGEAYCYLGFAYGQIAFRWGDAILDKVGMSVEEAYHATRAPKAEVLEYAYECLDSAAVRLPLAYAGEQRFTKGAALGFKARTAIWNNDYATAEKAARAVMDLGVYSLHPNYGDLFTSVWSDEIIFGVRGNADLQYTFWQGEDVSIIKHHITRNTGGWGSYTPSYELMCAYPCIDGLPIDKSPLYNPKDYFENRDPRMAMTIVPFATAHNKKVLAGEYDPMDYIHLGYEISPSPLKTQVLEAATGKMVSNKDSKACAEHATYSGLLWKKGVDETLVDNLTIGYAPTTYPYLRYADILLIYAEAMIEQGKCTQEVLDESINAVRARAYNGTGIAMPKVTVASQAELRTILRTERFIELAHEGHRYEDLLRWRIAEKIFNTPMYYLNRAWSGSTSWKGDVTTVSDTYRQMCRNWEEGNYPIGGIPSIDENGIADLSDQVTKGYLVVGAKRVFDPERDYLWPIPASEILVNPALTQNPKW